MEFIEHIPIRLFASSPSPLPYYSFKQIVEGGIYIYPATAKDSHGKLRLMYECNALAFVSEQAGGKAIDGKNRILDIQPNSLHQRTPFYVGSKNMVDKAVSF